MSRKISLWFLPIVLISLGAMSILAFARKSTLVCYRPEPSQIDCDNSVHLLDRFPVGSETVNSVSSAVIRTNIDDDDDITYRVELVSDDGNYYPLVFFYTSDHDAHSSTALKINTFITNSESGEQIQISSGQFWIPVLAGSLFILVGVGCAYLITRQS